MLPTGMDLSKVIIQNRHNNNNRYRWVRNNKFCFRSMLSGRFYSSKKSRDHADTVFLRYNYQGIKPGFLENPLIGAENLKKIDNFDNKLSKKPTENNVIHNIKHSDVSNKIWENENMRFIRVGCTKDTTESTRNGVPVTRKRFCQRVPVGQEHTLAKSGVEIQNCA